MNTMTKEQANKEIDAIYERLFDPQTSATMDKETQDTLYKLLKIVDDKWTVNGNGGQNLKATACRV